MTEQRAHPIERDNLAFMESWTQPRPDAAERTRRLLCVAALWAAVIVAEIVVVGFVYRLVMAHIGAM